MKVDVDVDVEVGLFLFEYWKVLVFDATGQFSNFGLVKIPIPSDPTYPIAIQPNRE